MTRYDVDELNETFSAHETLAADSDAVLVRSREIARDLRRRRWVLRTTGTVAVTAGVVAGAITLPGALRDSGHEAVIHPAAGGSVAVATHSTDAELAAFFNAGYEYQDAQQLAKLWHETDLNAVKAEAGDMLLDDEKLPISPSGKAAAPENLAVQAFFDAGYTYDDAVELGKAWHETDTYNVKVEAGKKLENGETLPIQP